MLWQQEEGYNRPLPRWISVYGESMVYNSVRFEGIQTDIPVAVLFFLAIVVYHCEEDITLGPEIGCSILLTLIPPPNTKDVVCIEK